MHSHNMEIYCPRCGVKGRCSSTHYYGYIHVMECMDCGARYALGFPTNAHKREFMAIQLNGVFISADITRTIKESSFVRKDARPVTKLPEVKQ